MILLFDRLLRKITFVYRKYIFAKKTNTKHWQFKIRGPMTLLNNNVIIGQNVTFWPNVMLFGDGPIEIGNNVSIGNGTIIYSSKVGGVKIGSNTQIAAQCYIIDTDHGIKSGELIRNQQNAVDPVSIGEDCWLAEDVTVLKGSNIKNGAVIGAKSLVKGEIPGNSVCVGIPARVIKYRDRK